MYQHVVLEDVAGGEGLAAGAADVGALVGVGALVLHPRGVVGEASSAILAGKRTLPSVLAHVAF